MPAFLRRGLVALLGFQIFIALAEIGAMYIDPAFFDDDYQEKAVLAVVFLVLAGIAGGLLLGVDRQRRAEQPQWEGLALTGMFLYGFLTLGFVTLLPYALKPNSEVWPEFPASVINWLMLIGLTWLATLGLGIAAVRNRRQASIPAKSVAALTHRLLFGALTLQLLAAIVMVAIQAMHPTNYIAMQQLWILVYALLIPPALLGIWFLARAEAARYRTTAVVWIRLLALLINLCSAVAATVLTAYPRWRQDYEMLLGPCLSWLAVSWVTLLATVGVGVFSPWGRLRTEAESATPEDHRTGLEGVETQGNWDEVKNP